MSEFKISDIDNNELTFTNSFFDDGFLDIRFSYCRDSYVWELSHEQAKALVEFLNNKINKA